MPDEARQSVFENRSSQQNRDSNGLIRNFHAIRWPKVYMRTNRIQHHCARIGNLIAQFREVASSTADIIPVPPIAIQRPCSHRQLSHDQNRGLPTDENRGLRRNTARCQLRAMRWHWKRRFVYRI
jgi:hypothetical protein